VTRKKTKQRRPRFPGWTIQILGKKAPRRMSDTLIEFARPDLLREEGSAEEWQYELKLAAVIWNEALTGKTSEELLAMLFEMESPLPRSRRSSRTSFGAGRPSTHGTGVSSPPSRRTKWTTRST
jgi:redox-regulated HSP33 family molecular chaperone